IQFEAQKHGQGLSQTRPYSSHDQQEEQHQHLEEQVDHSDPDKYEGDQLENSVLKGHLGDEKDSDLVNSSGVPAVEQHDITSSTRSLTCTPISALREN
ncbi:hypothetical protein pipiens_019034, partial [Culex pipiens pipiens]